MSEVHVGPDLSGLPLHELLDHAFVVGEIRTGTRRFWTNREIRLVREIYPTSGLPGCIPLLPGRTAGSIYQRACQLKLASPMERDRQQGVPRQKWTSNEHIDGAIRRGVSQATSKGDMLRLAQSLNRPRYWVSQQAAKLGCVPPRFKEPPWTQAELDIIANAAHLDPKTLKKHLARAGFQRTATAVVVKLKRLGADRTDPHHCTANALATLMGVDRKTVCDWITKGWLAADRRGNQQFVEHEHERDHHWIRYTAVRRFIVDHPAHVDIRKVDKFWFIDLLAGPAA